MIYRLVLTAYETGKDEVRRIDMKRKRDSERSGRDGRAKRDEECKSLLGAFTMAN